MANPPPRPPSIDGDQAPSSDLPPRSLSRSSLRLLGAGFSRLETGLDDLGRGVDQTSRALRDGARQRGIDGHRVRALGGRIGVASSRIRETVQQGVAAGAGAVAAGVGGEEVAALDGRRVRALGGRLGVASSRIRDTVKHGVKQGVGAAGTIVERSAVRVNEGLVQVGEGIQQVVSDMEGGRGGATATDDDLRSLRRRIEDGRLNLEAENLSRDAEKACMDVILVHLDEFLSKRPDGTYEQWLRELHPENDYEGRLLQGFSELDHRFYVKESDHLRFWNESIETEIAEKGQSQREPVAARYRVGGHEEDRKKSAVDLLDMAYAPSPAEPVLDPHSTSPVDGVTNVDVTDDLLSFDVFDSAAPEKKAGDEDVQAEDDSEGLTDIDLFDLI